MCSPIHLFRLVLLFSFSAPGLDKPRRGSGKSRGLAAPLHALRLQGDHFCRGLVEAVSHGQNSAPWATTEPLPPSGFPALYPLAHLADALLPPGEHQPPAPQDGATLRAEGGPDGLPPHRPATLSLQPQPCFTLRALRLPHQCSPSAVLVMPCEPSHLGHLAGGNHSQDSNPRSEPEGPSHGAVPPGAGLLKA